MVLVQVGLFRIFKIAAILAVSCAILVCFLFSYAYIGGDHIDRDDMQRTVASIANDLNELPLSTAEAESTH